MRYFSTNDKSIVANFREATIKGLAPDRGLYFPETVPVLERDFILALPSLSKTEMALHVMKPYVGDEILENDLRKIIKETLDFPIPLIPISENISTLELFHGPTLAFKDVGARFMSRCLGYFARQEQGRIVVLVATSGDTGGAVAHGFYDVPGVDVVILYPSGKVSHVQEKQLTTLGKNIHSIEVSGNFDQCQQMVKEIFLDADANKKLFVTSANSINVARWLPQQLYYFLAWKQWGARPEPPVVAVPSGNFGNICAGLLAAKSGLPSSHFVAACNANDVVARFFSSGHYDPQPAKHTISNAMDVGDPSNFVRILEMFSGDAGLLKEKLSAYSFTDDETKDCIRDVYANSNYLLDPHGAVGYLGLKKYIEERPGTKGYFLETAHPVKFHDVMEPIINREVPVPPAVAAQMKGIKKATSMPADALALKQFLLEKFS